MASVVRRVGGGGPAGALREERGLQACPVSELLGACRTCRLPRAAHARSRGSSAVDPLAAVSVRGSDGCSCQTHGKGCAPRFLPRGEAARRVPGRTVGRPSGPAASGASRDSEAVCALVKAAGPQPHVRDSEDRFVLRHRSEKSHDRRVAKPLKQRDQAAVP